MLFPKGGGKCPGANFGSRRLEGDKLRSGLVWTATNLRDGGRQSPSVACKFNQLTSPARCRLDSSVPDIDSSTAPTADHVTIACPFARLPVCLAGYVVAYLRGLGERSQ